MALGDLFLSAFIETLVEQLVSSQLLDFAGRVGLQENLEQWRKTLSRIQAVLDDAEEKQHTVRAIKMWLDDLRDLAYDLDDILDEFTTETLVGENQASTNKVRKLISGCVTRLTSGGFMLNSGLESKIKEISTRFKVLIAQKGELSLNENVDRRSDSVRRRLPPTSLVNEARVYGREKDKKAVLELLLSEKCSDVEVSVLPIVGMGGIGKTTLAQLVYNDKKVQSFFDLKAWACVSVDFDVVVVTKTILESVCYENCDGKDLNWMQEQLKEKLCGKKFLVILDDIWNENYDDWTVLRAPFEAGAPGSSIVITTRNQAVSSIMGTVNVPAYHLQVLSNDACLSIFSQHALDARDFSAYPNLIDIGEEIVKRCKGLPLVAKTLGGLLRTKLDRNEWKDILNSKIWDIPEGKSGIVPALMLSYHHLPSHLKRCFAYCSILPRDFEFQEKQLVLLWIAEGLIQPREEEGQMEDLGSKYFHDLLSRSFFQQSSKDKSRFIMHDLINDLAQSIAGDICFRMEDRFEGRNKGKISKKARHSSYLAGKYDAIKRFEAFSELTCLRTFLPFRLTYQGICYLTRYVPHQLLPKLRCLRALSLNGYCITELPDSIGDLKHLRYLDLSYTDIRSLPESTATLYKLQTLLLEKCRYLKKLPTTFVNLVNLRHLNILRTDSLEGMPLQIGKLTCLQTLSNLVVGKDSFSGIEELGPLPHLRGTLCISRLENVSKPQNAWDAKLIEKSDLNGVSLEWSGNLDESQGRTMELEVLSMLQPQHGLKELTIKRYGGTEFPTWLRDPSFPHMVLLRIENCKNCTSLPSVGQLPSLKHLYIKGMASVKNVGFEFYGEGYSEPFRSLETLHFENMLEWENWNPCEEFTNLRKLSLQNCPKLRGKLPNRLPRVKKVEIVSCRHLAVSISSFPELCELSVDLNFGVVRKSNVDFWSLRSVYLSAIPELTSRIDGFSIEGLTHVEDLKINNGKELVPLWSSNGGFLQHLSCLRILQIYSCPNLVSLVVKEVEDQLQLGLPSILKEIHIHNCNSLESLPRGMVYNSTCLEYVRISGCASLTYFAIHQLPPTLKRLKIESCKNMRILVEEDDTHNCSSSTSLLEYLVISYCPSLESLTSSGELPATLKYLRIHFCPKLESIAKRLHHSSFLEYIRISNCENLKYLPTGIQSLHHLDKIYLENCPTLVSLSDGDLLPANLRVLQIDRCTKMQALPSGIHRHTCLQELRIWECSGMTSFPEQGFPVNITTLDIWDLKITEALFEWGLHRLTSLKELVIRGGCSQQVSFPEMMLPPSLTALTIAYFPNLEYLSSGGFRVLTSLEELSIKECEKLMSFPEDGLPPSLLELDITGCPLLEEQCKNDGREWSKIAHIPCVGIDGRFIYDPKTEDHEKVPLFPPTLI
ncbi:putative disease resistance RPP13-like protein 1 [Morella rubra]|uniref:Putative disease resistance RPP13-like protein 1 n=1 Tax=Morella rubra TaxID=262757 RepID=A0A6A1W8X3_9ROSI|nr:putative disease resistance RPP13-like protein 1 [Morella rubra]